MLVSIILVVKNEAKHILKCIESLLNQSYRNFEIIILDDQSSDETLDLISTFKSTKLKIYSTESQNLIGHANRRNYALSKAKGEFIFFTDGDCFAHYNWVEEALKIFQNKNCLGVEGKTIYEAKKGITVADYVTQRLSPGGFMTCNVAYRKSAINDVGKFDPKFKDTYEDRDLGIKISKIGKVIFEDNMLVFHQQKKVTIKTLFKRAQRAGDMVYFDLKHGRKASEYIAGRIIYPEHLFIIFFPPLIFLSSRITSFSDIFIAIFKYFSFIYERIIIWKNVIRYKKFLI